MNSGQNQNHDVHVEEHFELIELTERTEINVQRCRGLKLIDEHKYKRALAAVDAISDTTMALVGFADLKTSLTVGPMTYLGIYGFLQAIYSQQNALIALGSCFDLKISVESDAAADDIRNVRHLVIGHPIATQKKKKASACFIDKTSLIGHSFDYLVYSDFGMTEKRTIFPFEAISIQTTFAETALQIINERIEALIQSA